MIRCTNPTCTRFFVLYTGRAIGRAALLTAALEEEGWLPVHDPDRGTVWLCPRCRREIRPEGLQSK